MRNSFALAVTIALVAAGCRHDVARTLTEAEILQIAKRDSLQSCRQNLMPKYEKVGCTYRATFFDGHWSVIVHPDYRDSSGKKVGVTGSALYMYTIDGNLIRNLPGM